MNTLPRGYSVGHWTDMKAVTGCTVILCPRGTVASCDVRGSSPGSRELSLLAVDKKIQEVHAVLLTGGSAFGLAAADGVVKYLEEHGIGYETPWLKVPLVPAAVIFDLNIGSKEIRPAAESGYAACASASADAVAEGTVGAGTGATIGKWAGTETRMKGGIGISSVASGELLVTALAVVNSVGDVLDERARMLAGARSPEGAWLSDQDVFRSFPAGKQSAMTNTTLVALLTNAKLGKVEAHRLAQRGYTGMARAVRPLHTSYDGDVVFALASGLVAADFDLVAEMGAEVTAQAIRRGVMEATSVAGVQAWRDLQR